MNRKVAGPWGCSERPPGDASKELAHLEDTRSQAPLRLAYRPKELADLTGISESSIRNFIKRGTLRAVRWDDCWLIPAAEVAKKLVPFGGDGEGAEPEQVSA